MHGQARWLRGVTGCHKCGPGFSRLRLVLRRFARGRRYVDQHFAIRALHFTAGKLFIAQEVLLTMRTRKFKLAHKMKLTFVNAAHRETY